MTRINAGVHPQELPSKLLLAEHREITRIPNAVRSGRAKLVNLPSGFKLGSGHVKWFYTRLGYLHRRYLRLWYECKRRGFDVTSKHEAFSREGIPAECFHDWEPTEHDRQLIIARIESKGFKLL